MTSTAKTGWHTSRRDLLIGGIAFSCAGLAWAGARETEVEPLPDGTLEGMMPPQLGRWQEATARGVIMPAESELSERVYNETLTRIYHDNGDAAVALVLAYGASQSRDMQLHRPEVCYPAAGFAIESSEEVELRLPGQRPITATLLGTRSPARKEQVLYWTRVGNEFPTTPLAQRVSVVSQNLRGRIPDGMLVRTSTIAPDTATALPLLEEFLSVMMANVSAPARQLLVGAA